MWKLAVGAGEGWAEEDKGGNWDNCNRITIKNDLNTGYKDAQGPQRGPQQHKKDPVRNKGHANRNKEQFTGKQQ